VHEHAYKNTPHLNLSAAYGGCVKTSRTQARQDKIKIFE
jgi:hypothetical protein